jgi:hypothetical protein
MNPCSTGNNAAFFGLPVEVSVVWHCIPSVELPAMMMPNAIRALLLRRNRNMIHCS